MSDKKQQFECVQIDMGEEGKQTFIRLSNVINFFHRSADITDNPIVKAVHQDGAARFAALNELMDRSTLQIPDDVN